MGKNSSLIWNLLLVLLLSGCSGGIVKEIAGYPSIREKVNFAGFAMLGDQESAVASKVERVFASGQFDRNAQKDFLNVQSNYFELYSGLADIRDGESITLALALDRETILEEKVADQYKLIVRLNAQLLFFDFEDNRLLAAYPVTTACIDIQSSKYSRKQKDKLIGKLLLEGIDGCVSLLDRLKLAVESVSLKASYGNYLQIRKVDIDSSVSKTMSLIYQKGSETHAHVAQVFSGSLSKYQGVPLLPYKINRAIGNTMSGRFSNGDVFNLSIPESDFVIDVKLVDAGTGLYKTTKFEKTDYYFVTALISVSEPLTGKVYMDSKVRNVEMKTRPVNTEEGDAGASYEATMKQLFGEFSRMLSNPSASWAKRFTGKSENKSQLLAVKKIVDSCK